MRFRKKPVVIEAIQWTGSNDKEIGKWIFGDEIGLHVDGNLIKISTLEGVMHASIGDWIIKGVKGEFYPCKPDIFDQTYDPVKLNEANCREVVMLTTDAGAFNATGQVFEEAHLLRLTERQTEVIENLQKKGQLITKLVIKSP